LHLHLLVLLKNYNAILRGLQSRIQKVLNRAKKELFKQYKNRILTSLVNNPLPKYFQHETKCKSNTTLPQLKSNLRELRHKEGCKVHRREIDFCADCGKYWPSEEIVQIYAKHKTFNCESLQILFDQIEENENGDLQLLKDFI
jgi:hypothetical protein